ncbi:hypothetical protein BX600DRAFT_475637 [Xylariales sp. PMI_506]|nr:hypothetical protein BX600DRAFT_475637 [Xylariales sp. PMI_506]
MSWFGYPAQACSLQEAATAAFLAKRTQLPIPQQFYYGGDSPVGPFVMMECIDHCGSVSARLTTPSEDSSAPHVLNPNTPESTLEAIWGQIATYLLQLSQLTFPRIGSLLEVSEGSYEVAGRPMTHNMTDMVRLANIPRAVLPPPGKTYMTADEWYVALSEMHIAQLIFQQNDLVVSAHDCRNKYVARQIFRRLARQGRLSTFGFAEDMWSAQSFQMRSASVLAPLSPAPSKFGSFRFWGDDFRAGNILLKGTDEVAALIDWEFSYAGPTQFILDPPWWLLLETAEMWPSGMDDWCKAYELRLKTWLSAMEKAEANSAKDPDLPVSLSQYMRESWETGRFFLSYGARKSWAFDAMYWKFLDKRFFGPRETGVVKDDLWKTRVHLLSQEEREAMEPFVERKMAESQERMIVDWNSKEAEAAQLYSELLFDYALGE